MDKSKSALSIPPARLLALDSADNMAEVMSQLSVIEEILERIESDDKLEETPRLHQYFDMIGGSGSGGILAVLLGPLKMSIKDAMNAYIKLYNKAFASSSWSQKDLKSNTQIVREAIKIIANEYKFNLDEVLESSSSESCKSFVCTLNPQDTSFPRLFRTYKARSHRSPKCTIAQALEASIPNLEPLTLGQPAEQFVSATLHHSNPSSHLLAEAQAAFGSSRDISCIVSLGTGRRGPSALPLASADRGEAMQKLALDADKKDEELERRCGDAKDFYFRLNVAPGLDDEGSKSLAALTTVTTHTKQYLNIEIVNQKIDRLVKALRERPGRVTTERLNSILGPDARDQILETTKETKVGVKHLIDLNEDDHFHKILAWLSPVLSSHINLMECQEKVEEGTGDWFLTSEKFQKWLAGKVNMLALVGPPGGGKTILASMVYNRVLALGHSLNRVALAAFVKSGVTESVTDILTCLFAQPEVLIENGTVAKDVDDLYKELSPKSLKPTKDQLLKALRSRLKNLSSVVIVLDALDEFPPKLRTDLLQAIFSLSEKKVQLFVTSRLDMKLDNITPLIFRMNAAEQSGVALYIRNRILRDPQLLKLLGQDLNLQNEVIATILSKCSNQFLLAKFHVDELSGCRTKSALKQILDNLPSSLDATYKEAYNRIENQKNARDVLYGKHMLMWVTLSRRPLSIRELQLAIASSMNELSDTAEIEVIEFQELNETCGGLIEAKGKINQQTASFVHLTAKEYFDKHYDLKNKASAIFRESQRVIATACLRYMSKHREEHIFMKWLNTSGSSGFYFDAQAEADVRFFGYCATNWGAHVPSGEDSIIQDITNFFGKSLSYQLASSILLHRDNIEKFTPLHMTSYFGLASLLSDYLSTQAVDGLDQDGRSPLSYAAQRGNIMIVQALLNRTGIDVNSKNTEGRSPLSFAAKRGHRNIVDLLLCQPSIEVNSQCEKGRSPLSYASRGGHQKVVELLLEREDVNDTLRDKKGSTPLLYAAKHGHRNIMELLLKRPKNNINDQSSTGRSLLSYAAEYDRIEVVKFLLAQPGIIVNSQCSQGLSPLSYAAMYGNQDTVKMLLSRGEVNVNLLDKLQRSAITHATHDLDEIWWSIWAINDYWETIVALLSHPKLKLNRSAVVGIAEFVLRARKIKQQAIIGNNNVEFEEDRQLDNYDDKSDDGQSSDSDAEDEDFDWESSEDEVESDHGEENHSNLERDVNEFCDFDFYSDSEDEKISFKKVAVEIGGVLAKEFLSELKTAGGHAADSGGSKHGRNVTESESHSGHDQGGWTNTETTQQAQPTNTSIRSTPMSHSQLSNPGPYVSPHMSENIEMPAEYNSIEALRNSATQSYHPVEEHEHVHNNEDVHDIGRNMIDANSGNAHGSHLRNFEAFNPEASENGGHPVHSLHAQSDSGPEDTEQGDIESHSDNNSAASSDDENDGMANADAPGDSDGDEGREETGDGDDYNNNSDPIPEDEIAHEHYGDNFEDGASEDSAYQGQTNDGGNYGTNSSRGDGRTSEDNGNDLEEGDDNENNEYQEQPDYRDSITNDFHGEDEGTSGYDGGDPDDGDDNLGDSEDQGQDQDDDQDDDDNDGYGVGDDY